MATASTQRAGPRTPKSKTGGTFPQTPASHSKSNGRKNRSAKSGSGSGQKAPRPTQYKSYHGGVEDAVELCSRMPQCVIGAHAFLTFMPHHLRWAAVMCRLMRNGWTVKDIAKAQLWARGRLTIARLQSRRDTLRQQQIKVVDDHFPGHTPTTLRNAQHPDFLPFVNDPTGNNNNLYDVRLPLPTSGNPPLLYQPPLNYPTIIQPKTLAEFVRGTDPNRWPSGQDECPLVRALRYARANNLLATLTVDDIPNIITQQGFAAPTDATTNLWDRRAASRANANIPDPAT